MNDIKSLAKRQGDALRALADMLDEHPEFALDIDYALGHLLAMPMHNPTAPDQRERLVEWSRAARKHGATSSKDATEDRFRLEIKWGDALKIEVLADRNEVCERVVTGTEKVTRQVPDPSVEVPMVEVTEEVETVEWVCRPLLAAEADEEVAE